jgi:Ca2+:H+ antiporter
MPPGPGALTRYLDAVPDARGSRAALSRRVRVAFGLVGAAVAASAVTNYTASGTVAFPFALVALIGVAWLVSFATEALGEHFGPSITGVLQSTLGNLPEFFVVIFALRDGQVEVAQTSLLGSILANALLVLGLVIVVGAMRSGDGVMRFSPRLPNDTSTLLLSAVFLIVLLGVAATAKGPWSGHEVPISAIGSVVLLVVYVTWLVPYLRADSGGGQARPAGHAPRLSLRACVVLLAVAGVGAAFVSEWFISSLQPTLDSLNLSAAFAGLVIVAVAGNAAENATGLVLASKGDNETAVSVVKNSVGQIAAFLFPLLVLVSLLFSSHLTFLMAPVYIAALAIGAILVWQITGDGEATLFEGVALVGAFIVLGSLTFYA